MCANKTQSAEKGYRNPDSMLSFFCMSVCVCVCVCVGGCMSVCVACVFICTCCGHVCSYWMGLFVCSIYIYYLCSILCVAG